MLSFLHSRVTFYFRCSHNSRFVVSSYGRGRQVLVASFFVRAKGHGGSISPEGTACVKPLIQLVNNLSTAIYTKHMFVYHCSTYSHRDGETMDEEFEITEIFDELGLDVKIIEEVIDHLPESDNEHT